MLYPLNKYLVVKPIEEKQKEQSMVLMPENVEVASSPFKLMVLIQAPADSKLRPDMKLLAPSHMIEQVSFLDETHYIVPEHCVVGFYGADE